MLSFKARAKAFLYGGSSWAGCDSFKLIRVQN